jgi:hypothetical protein
LEHTIRWLADLAFISGDYTLAMTSYASAANDFKNLKAFRHAASAYEMIAVTAYLRGDNFREIDSAFENAYMCY